MGASTNLSSAAIEVAPGASATVTLRVRNTATVVDQMSFEVIGEAKEWTRVEPPTLSLFPGDGGTVEVTFAPPRLPSVPAGPMPFGIKVQPSEDAEGSAVEEGTLRIGSFFDVSAELVPRTSRGRRHATHDLAVDNRSNVAYRADVDGTDKDLLLGITANPPIVDIAAGTAGFARVRVRPRRHFWRGPAQTRPFQVLLQPNAGLPGLGLETPPPEGGGERVARRAGGRDDAEDRPLDLPIAPAPAGTPPLVGPPPSAPPPAGAAGTQLSSEVPVPAPSLVVDGSFVQEALLPPWLFKVVAAIIALVVIAAALWLALVKPQIKAAAKNQVSKQLAAAGITTTTTTTSLPGSPKSSTTSGPSSGTAKPSSASGGAPSQSQTATTIAPSSTLSGIPVDGRLTASGNGTQTYVVPTGKTFQLTDIIFENPNGDTGTLVLARNGVVLLQTSLANFRDLDYHLVAPILFTSAQQMQMIISACTNACQPGMFYSGYLK
jgi:hypothetical protein